jgi:hypothetical protein
MRKRRFTVEEVFGILRQSGDRKSAGRRGLEIVER